jgi:hypothetical protein
MIYSPLAYEAQKTVLEERLWRASRMHQPLPASERTRGRRVRRVAAAVVFALVAWTLLASPSALATSVAPDHIVVSLSQNPPDAGQTVTVRAVAKDASGATLTAFSGPASWSDKSGALAPGAPADFVKGVSTTSAHFDTPYRADSIAIAAAGLDGQSRSFNVVGPAAHLELSSPSSPSAGAPFTITARARDAAGNIATGFADPATWSDTAGSLTPSTPADFVRGISTTTATFPSPVHNDAITLSAGGLSAKRTLSAVGPLDHLDAHVPFSTSLGVPFTLTVYARDAAGNLVNNTGDLAFNYTDSAGIAQGTGNPFSHGVSKTTITVVQPERGDSVMVITNGRVSGLSNKFNAVGPIDHLAISWTRTDGLTGCGDSITGSITVKTEDAAGNVVTGFNDANGTWGPDPQDAVPNGPGTTVTPFTPAPFINGVSKNPSVSVTGWLWLSTLDPATPNDFTVTAGGVTGAVPIC